MRTNSNIKSKQRYFEKRIILLFVGVSPIYGRAYNHTAHLDIRRGMMQTWSDYLETLATA